MNQQELRQTLDRLRAELAAQPNLDEASLSALRAFVTDLEQISLQHEKKVEATEPREPSSLGDQLRDAISEFEARHPTLTGALSGFIDRLVDMGI